MKFHFTHTYHFSSRIAFALSCLILSTCLCACTRSDQKPAGPPEKVTMAIATSVDAVLAQVAQVKGFFQQEGLEVTPHLHPYGKPALNEVLEGKADFATVAETPVMFAILNGAKISIIATIQTSDLAHSILARKDKGIRTLEDLKGKRIAVTLGTTAHFFLDAILITHGISRKDVHVVDLKAEEIPAALARGEVDAVSTFTLYTALTQNKLGDRVITFKDKIINRYPFNIVATQEFIRDNPEKITKVLRALVKAEEFVRIHPEETLKIVSGFTGVEIAIIRDIIANARFATTLDQSLVLALEDESRWAINNGLTGAMKVPNYLDYIYIDGLKSVKPEAVRILR